MSSEPVSQLVVIRGAGYDAKKRSNNEVLAVESDADSIAELSRLLHTEAGEAFHWMEWPTLSVVLLAERGVVVEYQLLSGAEWVRVEDSGDRAVSDPGAVRTWLAARGVEI
jgi:hypothetical protein